MLGLFANFRVLEIQKYMSNLNNPAEIWKDVKGFEGRYKISNLGNLKSIGGKYKSDKILSNSVPDSSGYYSVSLRSLSHGVKRKSTRIHQLVAEHFCKKPVGYVGRLEIDHKDSNKLNNRADNLRWVTVLEHRKISIQKGEFDRKGAKHHNVKLRETDVVIIRDMHKIGITCKSISEMYNVGRRHINDIILRKSWGWL